MVLSNLMVIWALIFHQRRCSYFENLPYTTTDVANAVLDGSDAILLGAETLLGLYPIETISTFGRICSERLKEINSWRWGSRSIFGVQFLCTVVFFLISQETAHSCSLQSNISI
ncbi:hypothetical protein S83_063033 [Arachis hypogaea]